MSDFTRWFPVSHDINRDPEVWALTKQCGDRSLRVWLEILSIADRNGGRIPGHLPEVHQALASASRVSRQTVAKVWAFAHQRSWISSSEPGGLPVTDCASDFRVLKYAKYHKSRGQASTNNESLHGKPLPDLPDLTSLTPISSFFHKRENQEPKGENQEPKSDAQLPGFAAFAAALDAPQQHSPHIKELLSRLLQNLGNKKGIDP